MSDWTRDDTYRELAYLLAHGADWGQTQYIRSNPGQFRELNPILGPHPSRDAVNLYFLATGLLHPAVSYALPSVVEAFGGSPELGRDARRWWQSGTLGLQAGVVGRNAHMGIGFRW